MRIEHSGRLVLVVHSSTALLKSISTSGLPHMLAWLLGPDTTVTVRYPIIYTLYTKYKVDRPHFSSQQNCQPRNNNYLYTEINQLVKLLRLSISSMVISSLFLDNSKSTVSW